MWFPSFFQILPLTQRGRVLFALVLAIFIGSLIGISQGPAPQAAGFDVRSVDAGRLAPVERTSIVGIAIPLPAQPPADVAAVSAEAVTQARATAEVLPTETAARDVMGVVVARADAFAPEPASHAALRMASAFAGVDSLGPPPVAEHWPVFASLAGGGGGAMVGGMDAPLLIGDTEKAAATIPPETDVATADPQPDTDTTDTHVEADSAPPAPAAAQAVPEPSSFLLMLVAMVGFGLLLRRQERQHL